MIRVVYWKVKKICALCQKDIVRRTAAMYDPKKSAEKRFVHLKCWTDLQAKRGIKLEEPPF